MTRTEALAKARAIAEYMVPLLRHAIKNRATGIVQSQGPMISLEDWVEGLINGARRCYI